MIEFICIIIPIVFWAAITLGGLYQLSLIRSRMARLEVSLEITQGRTNDCIRTGERQQRDLSRILEALFTFLKVRLNDDGHNLRVYKAKKPSKKAKL